MSATFSTSPAATAPTMPADVPKLAILGVVRAAFAKVAANPGIVLRLVVTWAAVAILCLLAVVWVGSLNQNEEGYYAEKWQLAVVFALTVPIFLGMSSVAVGWHRFILLGEMPGKVYLAAGTDVWRYLMSLILMMVLTAILVSIISIPLSVLAFSSPFGLIIVGLLCNILAMLMLSRLGMALPHIALGNPRSLGVALDKSAGNAWRMAIVGTLTWLPLALAVQADHILPDSMTQFGGSIPLLVVTIAVWLFASIASIGAMSEAYKKLWQAAE
jgi:hypothetical protein